MATPAGDSAEHAYEVQVVGVAERLGLIAPKVDEAISAGKLRHGRRTDVCLRVQPFAAYPPL